MNKYVEVNLHDGRRYRARLSDLEVVGVLPNGVTRLRDKRNSSVNLFTPYPEELVKDAYGYMRRANLSVFDLTFNSLNNKHSMARRFWLELYYDNVIAFPKLAQ